MVARQGPLLVGVGAGVVAVIAAVLVVRGSPKTIGADTDADAAGGAGTALASASAGASATAQASAEPMASAIASASATPSASASAPPSGSASAHAPTPAHDGGPTDTTAASAEAGAARPAVVKVDESNDGNTIELAPGQKLLATLDANPTTGFDWAVIKAPAALGSPAMGYVSSSSAMGAPGKRQLTWTLEKALPPGVHPIELGYARSFEKGVAPFKTFRIKVRAPR